MKIAPPADTPGSSFSNHRGGGISFVRLLQGDPDAPDNFEWSLITTGPDYATPRHRHNFDQLHLVLDGEHDYLGGKAMPTGSIAYFPEGVRYGPQKGLGGTLLSLQLGGAGGNGFLPYDRVREVSAHLATVGTFDNGIYRGPDAGGRAVIKDGYEAIYEHATGRPLSYPAPRYSEPVLLFPDAFAGLPTGEPGVTVKELATFHERGLSVAVVELDAGATHTLPARAGSTLVFVLAGSLTAGGTALPARSAAHVEPADGAVALRAVEQAEIYLVRLPIFGSPAQAWSAI